MRGVALLLAGLCLGGCAAGRPPSTGTPIRLAVLPFEAVGGGTEGARSVTRVFQTLLAQERGLQVVGEGVVEEVLVAHRIRIPVLMTDQQRDTLRSALSCDFLLTGSVLSFGTVNHPHAGQIAIVALTAQVVNARTGTVVWARTASRQGTDGQWLFGLGVERDPARLANSMCRDLLGQVPWKRLQT